jgi:hypothetical protein
MADLSHMPEAKTLELLNNSLRPDNPGTLPAELKSQLLQTIGDDVAQLLEHLQARGDAARVDAEAALAARGKAEADEMKRILETQRKRILDELGKSVDLQLKLFETDNSSLTDAIGSVGSTTWKVTCNASLPGSLISTRPVPIASSRLALRICSLREEVTNHGNGPDPERSSILDRLPSTGGPRRFRGGPCRFAGQPRFGPSCRSAD